MLAWRPPWDDSEVCSNPDSLSRDAMSTPGLFEFHPSNDAHRYQPGFPDHHRSGYRRPTARWDRGYWNLLTNSVWRTSSVCDTFPLSSKSRCRSITKECDWTADIGWTFW